VDVAGKGCRGVNRAALAVKEVERCVSMQKIGWFKVSDRKEDGLGGKTRIAASRMGRSQPL
jgi:hypothetical protein